MKNRRAHPARGFTLLELMVVVLIMGTVLLLVPANMGNFGARGKLESTANSLVAALSGARERAILDSYEVILELGSFRDDRDEWRHGWRFRFTNIAAPTVANPADEGETDDDSTRRDQDREWLFTPWHACQDGVNVTGISEQKGIWRKLNQGGKPHEVRFFADGNAEVGVAVRFESEDLEVEREYKTITVLLNPLTSEASWGEGELEMKEARPASDFGN